MITKDLGKHFKINSNEMPCFYIAKLFILKHVNGEQIFLFSEAFQNILN